MNIFLSQCILWKITRGYCNSILNWGIVLKDYKTYFEIVFLQDAKSLSLRNFDMCGCQTYVNHVIFGIWLVALTQWEFPTCFVWYLFHLNFHLLIYLMKLENIVHTYQQKGSKISAKTLLSKGNGRTFKIRYMSAQITPFYIVLIY